MYRRSTLCLAMAAAVAVPTVASANFFEDIEVNGFLKNETAIFLNDGQMTGEARRTFDDRHHSTGDLMKFENSARFFVNGSLGEDSSWHADINIVCDSKGVNTDWTCHKNYTQNDWLRELYADLPFANGDWSARLGKQQVVWGTADGIKLLDIINPTDFREMAQNQMEDSRIPIWMANVEGNVGDSGNMQFIVSEARENVIPGLNSDGDSQHPFIMKGVDSITGNVNGFLNVQPALSAVASSFSTGAFLGLINGMPSPLGLVPVTGLSVDAFAGAPKRIIAFPDGSQYIQLPNPDGTWGDIPPGGIVAAEGPGAWFLNNIAQNGLYEGDPNGNDNVTNLMPTTGPEFFQTGWNPGNAISAFEYMGNTSFATFNTFDGATSQYKSDYPSSEANAGLRYRNSMDNGLNWGVNYFYHYSANPAINMSWHDGVTGERLTVQRALPGDFINNSTGAPGPDGMPDLSDLSTDVAANDVANQIVNPFTDMPTILVHNSAGEYYGRFDPTAGFGSWTTNPVTMRIEESGYRVHSLGGSFDYGLELGSVPLVIRGEWLYDKDEQQPVVDKRLLGIGDLTNALTMEDMDKFSYVLGADFTFLTNMLVSGQFIQMRNLDYVDDSRRCTTQTGTTYDCSRYTADFSTVSMTNGMNQGWENKEFYSLFFSKPFGEAQLGRWNNITMYEDGGGWWNRFDVEYSFSDALVGSAELNLYWGDNDTTFGQFEESSNAQIGVKYIWE